MTTTNETTFQRTASTQTNVNDVEIAHIKERMEKNRLELKLGLEMWEHKQHNKLKLKVATIEAIGRVCSTVIIMGGINLLLSNASGVEETE